MKIVVYSPRPWEVPDTLLATGQHQLTRLVGEPGDMVRRLTAAQPDLVFLVGFEPIESPYTLEVEKLCLALPEAAVIALHPESQPEQLLALMRAGVREVIVDSAPETLQRVIERAGLRSNGKASSRGRVMGFVSAKGGDGGSCLAANLAVALSQEPGTRVLAIDISLPFGDLDMYLTGVNHPQDLADISAETERLDRSLIESMVQHISPTLRLIPSPASFEKTVHIEPERVSELIRIAATCYDYILLDFGSCLDQVGIWALEHLDDLAVVTSPSLPSLRRAGQLLKLSKDFDKPVSRIEIILNRAEGSVRLSGTEMEKVIGIPINRRIPSDSDALEESLLVGKPLMQVAPKSKLSKAFTEWSSEITGSSNQKHSLWQRLKIR
ncbi:AAA family ATPase [Pelodictyon luteolum]|uniref:Flp pilus assembly protein ATPase CpaE-like protein n=1 Tax=Chlorobium luteolum (strain DSM 273 / BCRC 81028 / 2530) TaxID=319225 RepID=Q3B547_CHLL3|nr:AAA family ATPase [Pelodictyon luteolum]ABB23534.1 Flp pilus assembly protein ATPase CpaE-like protein [Pelodictyon luteolum DSM 273]